MKSLFLSCIFFITYITSQSIYQGPSPIYTHHTEQGLQLQWNFPNATHISIHFSLPGRGWVALGFGTSMTNSDIILGYTTDNITSHVYDTWSLHWGQPLNDTSYNGYDNLYEKKVWWDNERTHVSVLRELDTGDQYDVILGQKLIVDLIYAWSTGVPGEITYHGQNHGVTQINLAGNTELFPYSFFNPVGNFSVVWSFPTSHLIHIRWALTGTAYSAIGLGKNMYESDIFTARYTNNSWILEDRYVQFGEAARIDQDFGGSNNLLNATIIRIGNLNVVDFYRYLVTGDPYDNPIKVGPNDLIYAFVDGDIGDFKYHQHQRGITNINFAGDYVNSIEYKYYNEVGNFTLEWGYPEQDLITFRITMQGEAWGAIGFGNSMTNTDMIIGVIADNGTYYVSDAYSKQHGPPSPDTTYNGTYDLIQPFATRINGTNLIQIIVTRKLNTGDVWDAVLVPGQTLNLVYAWRPSPNPDGSIQYHFDNHNTVSFVLTNASAPTPTPTPDPVSYKYSNPYDGFLLEWGYPSQDEITFRFTSRGEAWSGIGFGTSMDGTDMIIGVVADDGTSRVMDAYAPSAGAPPNDTSFPNGTYNLINATAQRVGNTSFVTSFTRKLNTGDPWDYVLTPGQKLNLVYAWLPGSNPDGSIQWHRGNHNATSFVLTSPNTPAPTHAPTPTPTPTATPTSTPVPTSPPTPSLPYQVSNPLGGFLLEWGYPTNDSITLRFTTNGQAWSAIGFGTSMTNTNMIIGVMGIGFSYVVDGYATGHSNPTASSMFSDGTVVQVGSTLVTTVTRKLNTTVTTDAVLVPGQTLNLVYAWLPNAPDGTVTYHGPNNHNGISFVLTSPNTPTSTPTSTPTPPPLVLPYSISNATGGFLLEWGYPSKDEITFRFTTVGQAWSAIGFGTSMTNTNMIIGVVSDNGTSRVVDTYSKQHGEPSLIANGTSTLTDTQAYRLNSTLITTVTRKLNTGVPSDAVLVPGQTLDLVYAWRPDSNPDGSIQFHGRGNHNQIQFELTGEPVLPYNITNATGGFTLEWGYPSADEITFRFTTIGQAWSAIGFGTSMTDTNMIIGVVADNGTSRVIDAYSHHWGEPDTIANGTTILSKTRAYRQGSTLITTVTRKLNSGVPLDAVLVPGQVLDLVYAWRPDSNPDGSIQYHGNGNHNQIQFELTSPEPYLPYHFTNSVDNFTIEWGYPSQDEITFRFTSPGHAWSGIGFGTTMNDTDMIIGVIADNGTSLVTDSYSFEHDRPHTDTSLNGTYNLINPSVKRNGNSILITTITRKLNTGDIYDAILVPGQILNLVYAWRNTTNPDGVIHYHDHHNAVSFILTSPSNPTPTPGPPTPKPERCQFIPESHDDVQISWAIEQNDIITFHVKMKTNGWIAIGLGQNMNGAEMYIGYLLNDLPYVNNFDSYSEVQPQIKLNDSDIITSSMIPLADGWVHMTVSRKLISSDKSITDEAIDMIWAYSDSIFTNGKLSPHGANHGTFHVNLLACDVIGDDMTISQQTWSILYAWLAAVIILLIAFIRQYGRMRKTSTDLVSSVPDHAASAINSIPLKQSLLGDNHHLRRISSTSFQSTYIPGVSCMNPLYIWLSMVILMIACILAALLKNNVFTGETDDKLHDPALTPDIAMFFAYITFCCMGFYLYLARPHTLLSILHTPITWLGYFPIGEVLLVASYIALNIWWIHYFWNLPSLVSDAPDLLRRIARVTGHTNGLGLSLLILPVQRNSIWFTLFGIPFDRALKYHKSLATYTFLSYTLHMSLWWRHYYESDKFNACVLMLDLEKCSPALFSGHMAWLAMVIMMAFVYYIIRIKRWELFYYTHHFFLVVYAFSIIHVVKVPGSRSNLIKYLFFTVTLYIIDRIIRVYRGRIKQVQVIDMKREKTEITRIEFSMVGGEKLQHTAGQYALISFPDINPRIFHPFSLSSAPSNATHTFHIKNMGYGTYTGRIAAMATRFMKAKQQGKKKEVKLLVDGPYGLVGDPYQHRVVVLIGGGVGVTPMISVLLDIHSRLARQDTVGHIHHVLFVWVVKQPICLTWFGNEISKITGIPLQPASASSHDQVQEMYVMLHDVHIHIQLYATNSKYHGIPSLAHSSITDSTNETQPNELNGLVSDGESPDEEHLYSLDDDSFEEMEFDDTSAQSEPLPLFAMGRPNLDEIMNQTKIWLKETMEESVMVDGTPSIGTFVCGPHTLIDHTKEAASNTSTTETPIHVYEHTFQF